MKKKNKIYKYYFVVLSICILCVILCAVCMAYMNAKMKNKWQIAAEKSPEELQELDSDGVFRHEEFDSDADTATEEKYDELSESKKKEYVFFRMLNTIDYFTYVRLEFDTAALGGDNCFYMETDLPTNMSKSISKLNGKVVGMESVANGHCLEAAMSEEYGNFYKLDYWGPNDIKTLEMCPKIPNSERMTTGDDGLPSYTYRNDPTNLSFSSFCLFPQEYAFCYLRDFSKWDIKGTESVCGRDCIVIQGTLTDYDAGRQGVRDFIMKVDKETGILMYLGGADGKPITVVKSCSYDKAGSTLIGFYEELLSTVQNGEFTKTERAPMEEID